MALVVRMSRITCLARCHARHATRASTNDRGHCLNSCLKQILDLGILREDTSVPFG